MTEPKHVPPKNATRPLPLQFDLKGKMCAESTKSPESFEPGGYVVLPPHDVIPIVFVPGVAGTNLKTGKTKTWEIPNGAGDGWNMLKTATRGQVKRQILFDPLMAEVDWNGPCAIDDKLRWLTSEEAKRRGWGAIHAKSYHGFLQELETALNDIVANPGSTNINGHFLRANIGFLEYLKGGLLTHLTSSTSGDHDPERDYGKKAEEAVAGWGKNLPALNGKEIHKLSRYYYPVWVYGYNWLQDNEVSAKGLLDYIDNRVLACYAGKKYLKCAGKVIIVTHSMGGLVARRAAMMLAEQGQEDKILGLVHGAQPVMGAPALYRRLRAGQEAGEATFDIFSLSFIEATAAAVFMGWSEQSMTVQLARAPGPLELAPTKFYPMNWLRVSCRDDRQIFSLPKEDPYAEIYSKTTDDCWWGMVNPAHIDPAGKIQEKGDNPAEEYRKAIKAARDFHDKLGLYAHPETYGFYGIDDEKYRSFGHVEWYIQKVDSPRYIQNAEAVKNAKAIKYASGEVTLSLQREEDSLSRLHGGGQEKPPQPKDFNAVLRNTRNQRGDGTVPEDSARVLEGLSPAPREVLAYPGFDHQNAFKDPYAVLASIYFIARIVQKAPPPTARNAAK